MISALVSLQSRHTENKWSEILIDGKSLGKLTSSLNETLNGIASAMEKNDIVYAGDILEYELPELLEGMVPFLEKILESVKN